MKLNTGISLALASLVLCSRVLGQGTADATASGIPGHWASDTGASIATRNSRVALELASGKQEASADLRFGPDDKFLMLNLSAPFDQEEGEALLGDLDRMGNSATAEIGFQADYWKGLGSPGFKFRAGAKFGRPTFKYMDLQTGAVTKAREESEELSAGFATFFPTDHGVLLAFDYKRVSAFDPAPARNICTPITGTTATECRSIATAAPTRAKSDVATAEVSFIITESFGMRLSVSRDFDSDVTGVEVPIYLIRDDSSGLFSGGLKLSWQSEEEDTQFILFFSQPIGSW